MKAGDSNHNQRTRRCGVAVNHGEPNHNQSTSTCSDANEMSGAFPLLRLLLVLLVCAPALVAAQTINAPGGVAAQNITNSPINFGLTPEQVKELTEAAARGATGPLTSTIVDLSKRLGVTEDATKTLLRIIGEQQDVPPERLSETLNRVANDSQAGGRPSQGLVVLHATSTPRIEALFMAQYGA